MSLQSQVKSRSNKSTKVIQGHFKVNVNRQGHFKVMVRHGHFEVNVKVRQGRFKVKVIKKRVGDPRLSE